MIPSRNLENETENYSFNLILLAVWSGLVQCNNVVGSSCVVSEMGD
jgi:hypothetical protein